VVALVDPFSTSTSLIFNAWPLNCVLCSASSLGVSIGQYTPSLPLSQHLIPSFNMPTLTTMQRHCTSQPPKRQFALPHRAQGPFRPYPPRNVPPLSTVALACLSASNPRLLSTTILSYPCPSCRKNSSPRLVPNSSIIAHIQRHLLTFQSSSRGRSRPPYMDFFLPICRCHESISYETPRFGGDDILC